MSTTDESPKPSAELHNSLTNSQSASEIPQIPGFVYIENFLTPEEQDRVLTIVDSHQWSKEIVRRQQFYGPVFYFTPQALSSTLQPVSDGVLGELYKDENNEGSVSQNNSQNNNLQNDNLQNDNNPGTTISTTSSSPENTQTSPNTPTGFNPVGSIPSTQPNNEQEQKSAQKQQTDLYAHKIDPLSWLIDKLIDNGLFERADARDPLAEYDLVYPNDGNNEIDKNTQKTTAWPRLKRVPPPPSTTPLSPFEFTDPRSQHEHLQAQVNLQNEQREQKDEKNEPKSSWGNPEIYPDQILVNEYRMQMGIGSHFDDALSFGPQIIGISLGDECTLILSRPMCCSMANDELKLKREGVGGEENGESGKNGKIIDQNDENNNENNETHPKGCEIHHENVDIEDCFEHVSQCSKSNTSHHISLRDFSRPDWKVGNGPDILGKYCRCTRQAYLTKHHPNSKYLVNLPIVVDKQFGDDVGGSDGIQSNKVNGGDNGDNGDNGGQGGGDQIVNQKKKNKSGNVKSTAHCTTYWGFKRRAIQEEFESFHTKYIESCSKQANDDQNGEQNGQQPSNNFIPQTQDDVYNFLLNFNFETLKYRRFHPRSGENLTNLDELHEIDELIRLQREINHAWKNLEKECINGNDDLILDQNNKIELEHIDQIDSDQKTSNISSSQQNLTFLKSQLQTHLTTLHPQITQKFLQEYPNYDSPPYVDPMINFTPTIEQFNRCSFPLESHRISVKPGSVYVMSGVSRYQYRHAIPKGNKLEQSQNNPDFRRVSLTIRSLLPGRRQVVNNSQVDKTAHKRSLFGTLSETTSVERDKKEFGLL